MFAEVPAQHIRAVRLAVMLGAAILSAVLVHATCGAQDQKQPAQESPLDRAVRELDASDSTDRSFARPDSLRFAFSRSGSQPMEQKPIRLNRSSLPGLSSTTAILWAGWSGCFFPWSG